MSGVLAQRSETPDLPGDTYISATYVKFLEAAGARVVPILYVRHFFSLFFSSFYHGPIYMDLCIYRSMVSTLHCLNPDFVPQGRKEKIRVAVFERGRAQKNQLTQWPVTNLSVHAECVSVCVCCVVVVCVVVCVGDSVYMYAFLFLYILC